MNKSFRTALFVAIAALTASSSVIANEKNYWTESYGNPVKNGTNELYWINCNNNNTIQNKKIGLKNSTSKSNYNNIENNSFSVKENNLYDKQDVFFDFDKHNLKSENYNYIDRIIAKSKNINIEKIVIHGFTDSLGKASYNKKLSELRAQSVKNYLISKGLEEKNISVIAHGSENPAADNSTEKGRSKNRRAEINLFIKK